MTQPTLAVPRILVIDDNLPVRIDAIRFLKQIPKKKMRDSGISHFECEEAGYFQEAEQLLRKATLHPYDMVLLDLKLPEKVDDIPDSMEPGHRLLKFIMESGAAKGVIIISSYDAYENIIGTIRGGALDFVKKPFHGEDIQPRVLNALERLMKGESDRILNQRVRDLVAYAEIGLAYSFRLIFNMLLEGVTDAAAGVEKYVRERYGLEREKDPDDALMLKLHTHRKAIARARQDWALLQAELARTGTDSEVGYVGKMLRDIKDSLLPCLVVRKVALDLPARDDKPVMTFEKDVEVVLREIVVGTLSDLPDYGEGGDIKISFTTEDTRVGVRFEDNLDPIPEEKIKAINEGQRILPDDEFGRAWGLSVAQHVALRGGGELVVKTARGRNIVTYYIPLADHA
jgi:FixJ family two-component response regulator